MEREQESSDMLTRLLAFHADPSERFTRSLSRWIEDPFIPRTKSGKRRLNPVLLLLLVLMALTGATFAFFSLVQ